LNRFSLIIKTSLIPDKWPCFNGFFTKKALTRDHVSYILLICGISLKLNVRLISIIFILTEIVRRGQ